MDSTDPLAKEECDLREKSVDMELQVCDNMAASFGSRKYPISWIVSVGSSEIVGSTDQFLQSGSVVLAFPSIICCKLVCCCIVSQLHLSRKRMCTSTSDHSYLLVSTSTVS